MEIPESLKSLRDVLINESHPLKFYFDKIKPIEAELNLEGRMIIQSDSEGKSFVRKISFINKRGIEEWKISYNEHPMFDDELEYRILKDA